MLDDSPTGDPIMDEALQKMAYKKKPDTLNNWVMALRILIYLNTYSGDCEHQFFPALGSAPF